MAEESSKLSKTGLRIKMDVEAIAEMERKIFEFLEQQHPDFLANYIILQALNSLMSKVNFGFR
jgi:hypothetical protein